jgi:hypothetical protein
MASQIIGSAERAASKASLAALNARLENTQILFYYGDQLAEFAWVYPPLRQLRRF